MNLQVTKIKFNKWMDSLFCKMNLIIGTIFLIFLKIRLTKAEILQVLLQLEQFSHKTKQKCKK